MSRVQRGFIADSFPQNGARDGCGEGNAPFGRRRFVHAHQGVSALYTPIFSSQNAERHRDPEPNAMPRLGMGYDELCAGNACFDISQPRAQRGQLSFAFRIVAELGLRAQFGEFRLRKRAAARREVIDHARRQGRVRRNQYLLFWREAAG